MLVGDCVLDALGPPAARLVSVGAVVVGRSGVTACAFSWAAGRVPTGTDTTSPGRGSVRAATDVSPAGRSSMDRTTLAPPIPPTVTAIRTMRAVRMKMGEGAR
jgi:hypothetical protein